VAHPAKPWVLGIAASHNGAACLLHGDEIVVAVQEERITRVKRPDLGATPSHAVASASATQHSAV